MDSFHCHQMDSITKQLCKANAELVVIAGGCTSILQTLDVSINKPFKGWLRESWAAYMRGESSRVEAGGGTCVGRYGGKDANGFLQQVVDEIVTAVSKLCEKPDPIHVVVMNL